MKRKIFISINIPSKTKKRLKEAILKWQDLPVKWVRENNLHITLAFLGFVDESQLFGICEKIRLASQKSEIFDLDFSQIEFFPSEKEPRLIALTGEASEELKNLVNDIENVLGIANAPKKIFRPHITLGRIRKLKWESLSEKTGINEKFPLTLSVETIDVMASHFGEGESQYSIIESCPMK